MPPNRLNIIYTQIHSKQSVVALRLENTIIAYTNKFVHAGRNSMRRPHSRTSLTRMFYVYITCPPSPKERPREQPTKTMRMDWIGLCIYVGRKCFSGTHAQSYTLSLNVYVKQLFCIEILVERTINYVLIGTQREYPKLNPPGCVFFSEAPI